MGITGFFLAIIIIIIIIIIIVSVADHCEYINKSSDPRNNLSSYK